MSPALSREGKSQKASQIEMWLVQKQKGRKNCLPTKNNMTNGYGRIYEWTWLTPLFAGLTVCNYDTWRS